MNNNTKNFGIVLGFMVSTTTATFAQGEMAISPEQPKDQKYDTKVWVGYNSYEMEDFNNKLSREGNEIIDGGINAGLEVSVVKVSIPGPGGLSIPLKIPLGIEYLNASSKTTHTGPGGFATVNWDIPVIGFFIAPTITLEEAEWFYIRPVGVGYYLLGDLLDADLTVTDRPGRLDVSADTVGLLFQAGIKYAFDNNPTVFLETGYRWLEFTDVSLSPKDGFTVTPGGPFVQPGNLPDTLDYSGFVVKVGVGWEFDF